MGHAPPLKNPYCHGGEAGKPVHYRLFNLNQVVS